MRQAPGGPYKDRATVGFSGMDDWADQLTVVSNRQSRIKVTHRGNACARFWSTSLTVRSRGDITVVVCLLVLSPYAAVPQCRLTTRLVAALRCAPLWDESRHVVECSEGACVKSLSALAAMVGRSVIGITDDATMRFAEGARSNVMQRSHFWRSKFLPRVALVAGQNGRLHYTSCHSLSLSASSSALLECACCTGEHQRDER
jgi:hypothetical protein